MKNDEKLDDLLRRSLQAEKTGPVPSAQIQRETIEKMRERYTMLSKKTRKSLCLTVLGAALVVAVPAGALAAWQLLSPAQLAHELQNNALEKAFASEEALFINQSVQSGGYRITLLGLVSGAVCSEYVPSDVELGQDRLYAAVAIENADGSPMPDTASEEYGEKNFLVTPLIQGQLPWQVNIFTMGGGYGAFVQNGIQYRLVECGDVTAFADRNVWLAVTDEFSISNGTFLYDETTGNVSENPDARGVNVLFKLPLDAADADKTKAEELLKQWVGDDADNWEYDAEAAAAHKEQYQNIIREGKMQEHKLLEQTADGSWWYFYGDGGEMELLPEDAQSIANGAMYTDNTIIMADTENWQAVLLGRDEQGRLYGELYVLPKTAQEKAEDEEDVVSISIGGEEA